MHKIIEEYKAIKGSSNALKEFGVMAYNSLGCAFKNTKNELLIAKMIDNTRGIELLEAIIATQTARPLKSTKELEEKLTKAEKIKEETLAILANEEKLEAEHKAFIAQKRREQEQRELEQVEVAQVLEHVELMVVSQEKILRAEERLRTVLSDIAQIKADINYDTNRKMRFTPAQTQAILDRQGGKCNWCHGRILGKDFEIDHHIPVINGGETTVENGRAMHTSCNRQKGDRVCH